MNDMNGLIKSPTSSSSLIIFLLILPFLQAYNLIPIRRICWTNPTNYCQQKAYPGFGQTLLRDNNPQLLQTKRLNDSYLSFSLMNKPSSTMFMTPLREEREPSTTKLLSQRSLASSYVISMNASWRDEKRSGEIFHWTFHRIDDVVDDDDKNVHKDVETTGTGQGGVGEKALRAMYNGNLPSDGSFYLKCQVDKSGLRIETDSKEEGELISVLSRVMVQTALDFFLESSQISIEVPHQDDPTRLCCETYHVKDLRTHEGYAPLFASLLSPKTNYNNVEMSDMVDGEGTPIGYIPRPLLHKFNVLHRGVGIIVCYDSHDALSSKIYVHQRVGTKRIFPSLYDMFVGGVCTSGEDLKLTAAREVGEELGLTRPSLSDELFKCTICTSYNRCVVTVFTYSFDPNVDGVKWQEEEVQWGDFVDYKIVEESAALCIERLVKTGCWPGSDEDTNTIQTTNRYGSLAGGKMTLGYDWDYVPDGLLVWVAWNQWLGEGSQRMP